jgi:hypothetical protein
MIAQIAFCIIGAIANRARGSQLFGLVSSTVIGRLVSMLVIAIGTALLTINGNWIRFDCVLVLTFATLMLWCTLAWDSLWGAAIGHDPNHSRLWGLMHLGLRMTLAAPCLIGLTYLTGHAGRIENLLAVMATPLLAVPYYIFGYAFPQQNDKYVVPLSELTVGLLLSALICLTVS